MRTFCEFVEQQDKITGIFEEIWNEAEQNPEFKEILNDVE
jgi:hypothetical protein